MTQEPLWQPSDILNAENEGDAESPKRRGRIPQSAWPRILERHKAGVTLSAIAREFDCTPSAISYIVRKAEAAGLSPEEGEGPAPTPAPIAVAAPAPEPVVEATRPTRRAPRAVEVQAAEPRPVPAPAPVVPPPAAPAPVAAAPVAVAPVAAVTEPVETPAARETPFLHDSGRGEAPRRFEGRDNRPPREPRPEGRENGGESREPRGDNRPEFRQEPREQREPRGDRQEFRGDNRQGDNRQGERRPQMGNVPRFPQGGQPGPQRERFGGERLGRDRLEGNRDGNRSDGQRSDGQPRPPRDFDRDRNTPRHAERPERPERMEQLIDAPPVDFNPSDAVYPYRQLQRNPARLEAQETPTVPADERMDTASKACAEAYRAWKDPATPGGVQGLTDALHELRKVIARMEIEISASRKEENRPVPFPAYRTNQPPPQQPRG